MEQLKVHIRTHAEIETQTPLFDAEDFTPGEARNLDGQLVAAGIVEGVTNEGKTGVALLIHTSKGHRVLVCLPAARYLTLAGGVKGAMERFGDDPSEYA